jgi:hypothetical protein
VKEFLQIVDGLPLPPAQRTSSYTPLHPSSPCPPASSAGLSAATTSHALVLEEALTEVPEKLPLAEKAVFAQPSKTFDKRTVLSDVQYLAIAPLISHSSEVEITKERLNCAESLMPEADVAR